MVKVQVNGCFDVLRRGHYELFNYAKSLGDKLAVGIDSDEKVSKDKGTNRPFNNINDRVYALQSLKAVNEVYVFNSRKELEDLIENYQPDYLVVGSDWKDKDVVGGHFAKEIVYFNRIEGYSTTSILTNDREQVI